MYGFHSNFILFAILEHKYIPEGEDALNIMTFA